MITKKRNANSNQNELINKKRKTDDHDLQIGSIVTGQIKRLNKSGLILDLGGREAFVPQMHVRENFESKNLEKLFPIGKEVKGRIFRLDDSVEPAKLCLTLRKSFLSPTFRPVADLGVVRPNTETIGLICLVKDDGLLLEFFNNLRAWVSKQNQSSSSVYKVGQLVRTRILNVNQNDCTVYATLLESANQLSHESERSNRTTANRTSSSEVGKLHEIR